MITESKIVPSAPPLPKNIFVRSNIVQTKADSDTHYIVVVDSKNVGSPTFRGSIIGGNREIGYYSEAFSCEKFEQFTGTLQLTCQGV